MTGMNADIDTEILVRVYENDFEIKLKWLSKYDVKSKLLWYDKGEGLLKITGKFNKENYRKMLNDSEYLDELCKC